MKIVTNTSTTVAPAGLTVWINDTTTPKASGTTTTLAGGLYNYTPSSTGFKSNDNVNGASHSGNVTGTNSTVYSTSTSGDWMNLTLKYPQLNPVLSSNVTSGEATLWVHFFNTGTPLGGSGSYTFSWIFGDGTSLWNQVSPYADHNYTAVGAYCAQLVVNDTAGDSWETPCRTITANPPPSLNSFTVTPDAVNVSQAVGFTTVLNTGTGTSPYSYTYQFGQAGAQVTDTSASLTNSTSHTYTAQTNYSYVANVTVKDNVGKSTNTSQQPVWVYLITMHANPAPTDQGLPVAISANALGGSGGAGFSYFFQFGDGSSTLAACSGKASCTVSHTYATAGSFTVTLYLNDSKANNSLTQALRAVSVPVTLPIVVNSALQAAITSNLTVTDVNQPVSLTATAKGGTAPYSFFNITSGAIGAGNFTNGTSAGASFTWSPVTYSTPGTYAPTAVIEDHVGEVAKNSTGVTVLVNPTPTVTLSVQGYLGASTTSAYIGESLWINATVTAGTGTPGYSFNISFGDGKYFTATCASAGCTTGTQHAYAATGPFTLSARVVDSVGGSGSVTQSITVYPALAAPTLVANRTAGEVNLHVALTSSVTGGVPGLTFSWQFGDGGTAVAAGLASGASNPQSHIYTVVQNTTVNVTINDTQGESVVAHLHMFIYPLLAASFTNSTATGNLNPPVNATFLGSASGGSSNYLFFNWSFGNGGSASGSSPTSLVTTYWASGTYQVNLTVADNVSDSLTVSETFTVAGVKAPLDLAAGWNLVSSPVANESYTLWSLFHVLTAIYGASASTTSLTVQNITGAGNVTYPGGGAFAANYAIQPGRGVWIDVAASVSSFVYGNLTAGPLYPTVSLQSGWNNVGWSLTGVTNASSLAALVTGCTAVSIWNATTQSYTTYIVGFSSTTYDFSVSEGMGVLVWSPAAGSFTE